MGRGMGTEIYRNIEDISQSGQPVEPVEEIKQEDENMNEDKPNTSVTEGEIVLIGTDHYKRVGDKLVNMNNPNDVRSIGEGGLLGSMLEHLDIMKG